MSPTKNIAPITRVSSNNLQVEGATTTPLAAESLLLLLVDVFVLSAITVIVGSFGELTVVGTITVTVGSSGELTVVSAVTVTAGSFGELSGVVKATVLSAGTPMALLQY